MSEEWTAKEAEREQIAAEEHSERLRNPEEYGRWGKLGKALKWLLRPLFWLLFPYKAKGVENIPTDDRPLIVCSNHISMTDPVFLLYAQKQANVYFMGKEELFRSGFLAWFLGKQCGAFPVSRGKGDTNALARAEQIIAERKWMGIFPEGTRSKTGELGRFKSGSALIAAKMQAHVLPVAITTKNQKVKLFRRVTVTFGAPLSPAELQLDGEKPNLRVATRAMTAAVSSLMGATE